MSTPRYAVIPVAVSAFLTAITTLAIVLRIVSRKLSKATLWWDDWLSIAAYPFSVALSILFLVAGFHGFGFHGGDPTFYLRAFYFGILWYYTGTALIKLSVLCFYYRIFSLSPNFTRTLWVIGGFVCIWWLSFMIATIFECLPMDWLWATNIEYTCIDIYAHCISNETINIAIDFVILVLPLRPLWKLQMERKQKLALAFVFVLGYLNPILSILRLAMTIQMTGMNVDLNYTAVAPGLCTSAEVSIAVVSASIPSLTHLFRRFINPKQKRKGSPSNSDSNTSSGYERPITTTDSNTSLTGDRSDVVQKYFGGTKNSSCKFGAVSHYGWYSTSVVESERDNSIPDLEGRIHVVREIDITVHETD